jgi:hypothetical protein
MAADKPTAYLIDGEDFAKLRALADALHAGNDEERDAGHKLWLVLNNAVEVPQA